MTTFYTAGGYIPGPTVPVIVADDECFLDRYGRCIRADPWHHGDISEIRLWGEESPQKHVVGPCIHRHVEPVESLTGEVVARLCLHCDAQLPA